MNRWMKKGSLLALFFISAAALFAICYFINRRFAPKTELSKSDKSAAISEIQPSNSENSVAICEFLACVANFREALTKKHLSEESKLLQAVQSYALKRVDRHEKAKAFESCIERQGINTDNFELLMNEMCQEQNNLAAPFFILRFAYFRPYNVSEYSIQKCSFFTCPDTNNFLLTDKAGHISVEEGIIASRMKMQGFDPQRVDLHCFPISLIVTMKQTGDLKYYITNSDMATTNSSGGYVIKAALGIVNSSNSDAVLRVIKCTFDAKSKSIRADEEAFIKKHGELLLYEYERENFTVQHFKDKLRSSHTEPFYFL
ncbi:hypothetical protein ENBRE01_2018 [Enteropsectra breve]|nr:hypothetical protein ENBRE01_2018 [Enteropsectra breve]